MNLGICNSENDSSDLLSAERTLSAHISKSINNHRLDLLHVLHGYCSVNQHVTNVVINSKTHNLLNVVGVPVKVFSKDSREFIFLLVLKVVLLYFLEHFFRVHAHTFSIESVQLVTRFCQLGLTGTNACFSVAHLWL